MSSYLRDLILLILSDKLMISFGRQSSRFLEITDLLLAKVSGMTPGKVLKNQLQTFLSR